MSFQKLPMWIRKKGINNIEKMVLGLTECDFETTCWALCGVKTTRVKLKLQRQLLLCGYEICLFLFDRTARIDTTEVLTCQGSFGGFETTCFQLDRAASFKTTGISYFSCDKSPPKLWAPREPTLGNYVVGT